MTSKSLKIIDFSRFGWGESPINSGIYVRTSRIAMVTFTGKEECFHA